MLVGEIGKLVVVAGSGEVIGEGRGKGVGEQGILVDEIGESVGDRGY